MKRPLCIYCGLRTGDTRDHAPPKCFFGSERPPNAITVPCCEACRRAGEKNETTIRNLLISFDQTETHPTVQSSLLGKRDRSFRHSVSEVRKLMAMMVDVDIISPGGIYLGRDKGFNLNQLLVHSFIERMSRALLYEEFQEPYFNGDFGWVLNPPMPDAVTSWMKDKLPGREMSNVFYYRITNQHATEPWWITMIFYGKVRVLARVRKGRA